MRERTYGVVDVFTEHPLRGNPVAVVLDAEDLDTANMQAIARWTQLSETTFLLPPTHPDADYRLRIFTPARELPFGGHPTLGSAHAALMAGRIRAREGRLIQECGVGLVELDFQADPAADVMAPTAPSPTISFALPAASLRDLSDDETTELEQVLGHAVVRAATPAIIDVGPRWIVAQLASARALLGLDPDLRAAAFMETRLGALGICVFGEHDPAEQSDVAIEVRAFAPSSGIDEDPVCGSGNGCVAAFRRERGLLLGAQAAGYVASQGTRVGRDGRIVVRYGQAGQIRIGGRCVSTVQGTLRV